KVALPRSPVDASLLTELNRVGVNLNQIARALNRGRDEDPHHLGHILHQLHTLLEKVGRSYGS
ncbi:plasmid mobilization relaxosome protein MobC, partial [Hoeflea sp. CAU 1731]